MRRVQVATGEAVEPSSSSTAWRPEPRRSAAMHTGGSSPTGYWS